MMQPPPTRSAMSFTRSAKRDFAVVSLTHIKRAADLDLQCMPVRAGAPVKAGGEPASIGCVDGDDEAAFDEKTGGGLDDLRSA